MDTTNFHLLYNREYSLMPKKNSSNVVVDDDSSYRDFFSTTTLHPLITAMGRSLMAFLLIPAR